jgi:hypothetical protein
MGRLRAGETILVHSAAGGVGLSAIDLAQVVGAHVIGVASVAKHDFLLRRGVQGLIDLPAAKPVADGPSAVTSPATSYLEIDQGFELCHMLGAEARADGPGFQDPADPALLDAVMHSSQPRQEQGKPSNSPIHIFCFSSKL